MDLAAIKKKNNFFLGIIRRYAGHAVQPPPAHSAGGPANGYLASEAQVSVSALDAGPVLGVMWVRPKLSLSLLSTDSSVDVSLNAHDTSQHCG